MSILNNNKLIIRYSQCWEDANIVLSALEIKSDDVVFSIGSGGENSFSILSQNPQMLYIVDSNQAQIHLIRLKILAIKKLCLSEFEKFIGIKKSLKRINFYKIIENDILEIERKFWQENIKSIEKGIIHSGKFEKYLNFFRKYVLIFIQPNRYKDFLLNCNNKNEQQYFYEKKWNNLRWRLIFNLFFGKKIMKKRGRSKEMFQFEGNTNSAQKFFRRIENGIKTGNIFENEYFEYILKGNYVNFKPHWLENKNIRKIKESKNYEIRNQNIFDFLKQMPDNSISKYNLSDIFEALSISDTKKVFEEILRTAKNKARIIFWNNLVYRDIPEIYRNQFILEKKSIQRLEKIDKIFFYEKFYIYEIKK